MSARLFASLVLLLSHCAARRLRLAQQGTSAGAWRAVLEVPGGELPFGLDVAKEEAASC